MDGMDGIDGIDGIERSADRPGSLKVTSLICWATPWQSPVQFQFQTEPELELAAAAGGAEELPQFQFQFHTLGAPGVAVSGELALGAPGALVPAAAPPVPLAMFCWSVGPSSPGLSTRMERLRFDWPGSGVVGAGASVVGAGAGSVGGVESDGAATPPLVEGITGGDGAAGGEV